MSINIIAAISQNGVIGKNGKLPWYYKYDLQYFKEHTINSSIIMGRKTFESIGEEPLPDRNNIVLSKSMAHQGGPWNERGDLVVFRSSIESALKVIKNLAGEDYPIWVIGGAQIYKLALPHAHRIYLTAIPEIITGNNLTFFPDWTMENYECVSWEQNFDDPRLYHSIYQRRDCHGG